ncbi:MAG TPA: MBL fold metallo-hydrolase [Blastocatellia bacterium]|nr:MBL fold metallo-hydrolase [Blastocatellia bacterium]
MPRVLFFLIAVLVLITAVVAHDGVHSQTDKGPFTIVKTSEKTYALFGRGGNVGIIVTDDGIVVIDDQFKELGAGIVEQVKKISPNQIRFLINTHHHGDHTGSNDTFIKLATVIAHDNVRKHMLEAPSLVITRNTKLVQDAEKRLPQLEQSKPDDAAKLKTQIDNWKKAIAQAQATKPEDIPAPNLTFSSEVRLYLGGEEIQVFHIKRGHTDGDSVIYLPKQKYLHMGDLYFNQTIPFIDAAGGADSGEWIESIDAVLARVAPDSQVVPGHGKVSNLDGLRAYRQYLVDLRAAVKKAVDAGMSREDAIKNVQLPQYSSFDGYKERFGSANVAVVYDEMKRGK